MVRDNYDYYYNTTNYLINGPQKSKQSSKNNDKDNVGNDVDSDFEYDYEYVVPQKKPQMRKTYFSNLVHDYQDPNRDKLSTPRFKQTTLDDYFKIVNRNDEVEKFNTAIDIAKYKRPPPLQQSPNRQMFEEQLIKQMQMKKHYTPVKGRKKLKEKN